jgi:hypothetical protein
MAAADSSRSIMAVRSLRRWCGTRAVHGAIAPHRRIAVQPAVPVGAAALLLRESSACCCSHASPCCSDDPGPCSHSCRCSSCNCSHLACGLPRLRVAARQLLPTRSAHAGTLAVRAAQAHRVRPRRRGVPSRGRNGGPVMVPVRWDR